jgi:putative acetyltransferase
MIIRNETAEDHAAIERVIVEAFRTAAHADYTEQFIVRALRAAAQLTVSLVAEIDGNVVGHVAASPVTISDGTDAWYGIGPLAVAPALHRRGIGSALMRRALDDLRSLGARGCVLLGNPEYYGRFGFKAEPTLVLPGVPAEYFQALPFTSTVPSGSVAYHPAFEARE